MLGLVKKIFGDQNERELKRMMKTVDKINAMEPEFERLSDEQLAAKTPEFRDRLKKGETLDDLLPEAFATVREASKRKLGMRHFDVQLIGGMVLHEGQHRGDEDGGRENARRYAAGLLERSGGQRRARGYGQRIFGHRRAAS